jgi:hypothetical protein
LEKLKVFSLGWEISSEVETRNAHRKLEAIILG